MKSACLTPKQKKGLPRAHWGIQMKTNTITKYSLLVLLSTSFIALNNCGNQEVSTSEQDFTPANGENADYLIVSGPPAGYPVEAPLPVPAESIEFACHNGVDDDGNGLVDCQDPNCAIHPECSEWGPPLDKFKNSRALTVYPNGFLVPEDIVILKARGRFSHQDPSMLTDHFFPGRTTDCWVLPQVQDPYYNIPLGEPLIAGFNGPIGPQMLEAAGAAAVFGPRAGLINECRWGQDFLFWHAQDDGDDDFHHRHRRHRDL